MNNRNKPDLSWILTLIIPALGLIHDWEKERVRVEDRKEEVRQKSKEFWKRSRPHVQIRHMPVGLVELIVSSYDDAGFYKTENFTMSEYHWNQFYQELRKAPPPPRN